ncbi:uncharacterized protein LOC131652452 [Vicia villosa]|uniref:uncharacterized protein LOC131652452 n=1 Tax=Vicia villosa TaxID=3911 RepID=UPI00273A97C5|nr:uncharacterized protein LOC131652452 [Vicia villosa]
MEQKLNLNEKYSVSLSPNSVLSSHQHYLSVKNKMATILEEREKIESSGNISHSSCRSDEEGSVKTPSQDSELSSQSPSVSGSWTRSLSNSFIELCINSDVCDKKSTVVEEVGSVNSKMTSDNVTNSPLQKVKVEIPHSHQPYPSEIDCSSRVSSKVSLTPIRKRLNPFTQSKKVPRNMACQKSLLDDFSNTTKDIKYSSLPCSPLHLHGYLKLKNKQGLPYFEFKVNSPKDVIVAKTWRVGSSAFNWVYTFHSFGNRKKNNYTGVLKSQHCVKDSSMIAQMLVSYSLCSELEGGVFGNYMVAEFVLHDFTHSRQNSSPKKPSYRKQDASKTLNASSLESAAIVLRIPFHKRESLKYKRGDGINGKAYSIPSDISSVIEQVKVVLPSGNHGLPSDESEGPSSLLDRWKHGGGCDCGGWDMACPLIVLGNPGIQFHEDIHLVEKYQPFELFSQPQGRKESSPTFGMKLVEEGQYAVDFHAKLSPLQAFSISVAILHGTSAFRATGQVKNQQLSQCNSLEEEV